MIFLPIENVGRKITRFSKTSALNIVRVMLHNITE